jgi:hypothetical protein
MKRVFDGCAARAGLRQRRPALAATTVRQKARQKNRVLLEHIGNVSVVPPRSDRRALLVPNKPLIAINCRPVPRALVTRRTIALGAITVLTDLEVKQHARPGHTGNT